MALPTENQVNAALRHVGTASASVASVFVVLGFLSPEQSAAVIADMQQIVAGLQQAFGGFSKLALVLGPVMATVMATYAAKSGSAASMLGNLIKMTHNSNAPAADEAKAAIVNVVAPALAVTPKEIPK